MAEQSGKHVKAVVEIGPNYTFHLMAVARIGFDSDYADRYQDTVAADDIAFLQKYRKMLTFGMGSGGDLVDIMIGFPAYFNLESRAAWEEYFSLLKNGLTNGDFKPFIERFADPLKRMETWVNVVIDEKALLPFMAYREAITRLGKIAKNNFEVYIDKVWKIEEPKLSAVAAAINDSYKNSGRIRQWEELTGLNFKFDVYHIVLCSAIKNGPDANSMGYDRVAFYHESPLEEIIQFISHEIGTHILIDDFRKLAAQNRFDYPNLYEAMECLAYFYNTLTLDDPRPAYAHRLSNFHPAEYLKIYKSLHEADSEISPSELLIKGIEKFQNSAESR